MKLSEFDTQMPKELIATEPSFHRDEARLMVLHRKTGEIEHKVFKEVLDYFNEDDLLCLTTPVFSLPNSKATRKRLAQKSKCFCFVS